MAPSAFRDGVQVLSEATPSLARVIRLSTLLRPPSVRPVVDTGMRRLAEDQALEQKVRSEVEAQLLPRIAALEDELERAGNRHEAALADAGRDFRTAIEAITAGYADGLAAEALDIARTVLDAEPGLSRETLRSLIAEALAGAASPGTLRVHPDMISLAVMLPPDWRMEADPALAPGTAIAESGSALALASLGNRLAQLAPNRAAGA